MTPARGQRLALGGIVVSVVGSALATLTYWRWDGQTQLEGLGVALALGGLAVTLVIWANVVMGGERVVHPRGVLTSSEDDVEEAERELADPDLARRTTLRRGVTLAVVAAAASAALPLRSLGPAPKRSLLHTPWRPGCRLITDDGRPVRAADVPVDGLVTVFPEGLPGSADGQAVLIRVGEGRLRPRAGRGELGTRRAPGVLEGLHPRGLSRRAVRAGRAPAPVPVPPVDVRRPRWRPARERPGGACRCRSCPLRIDADGVLVADGDFSDPVGPAFWEHR